MNRHVLVSAMVVFTLAFGCSRSAPEPPSQPAESPVPPPPPPPAPAEATAPIAGLMQTAGPCLEIPGPVAELSVAVDGTVTPECIEIRKPKKTKVVWTAVSPATGLVITFKPECLGGVKPDKLPDDPVCTGVTCTLESKGYAKILKKTEFCYKVVVTFADRPPVEVDPRLIINP